MQASAAPHALPSPVRTWAVRPCTTVGRPASHTGLRPPTGRPSDASRSSLANSRCRGGQGWGRGENSQKSRPHCGARTAFQRAGAVQAPTNTCTVAIPTYAPYPRMPQPCSPAAHLGLLRRHGTPIAVAVAVAACLGQLGVGNGGLALDHCGGGRLGGRAGQRAGQRATVRSEAQVRWHCRSKASKTVPRPCSPAGLSRSDPSSRLVSRPPHRLTIDGHLLELLKRIHAIGLHQQSRHNSVGASLPVTVNAMPQRGSAECRWAAWPLAQPDCRCPHCLAPTAPPP